MTSKTYVFSMATTPMDREVDLQRDIYATHAAMNLAVLKLSLIGEITIHTTATGSGKDNETGKQEPSFTLVFEVPDSVDTRVVKMELMEVGKLWQQREVVFMEVSNTSFLQTSKVLD